MVRINGACAKIFDNVSAYSKFHTQRYFTFGECFAADSATQSRSTPYLRTQNFIRRGIEAVITGLTRNQFVDNTTRGFESLPLRQKEKSTPCGCSFLFDTVGWSRTLHRRCEGSHTPLEDRQTGLSVVECEYLHFK